MILNRMLTVGGPPYTNAAGLFDASGEYLTRGGDLTGATDSPVCSLSIWYYATALTNTPYLIATGSGSAGFTMYTGISGYAQFTIDGAGSGAFQLRTTAQAFFVGQGVNILACFDIRDAAKSFVCIGGASPAALTKTQSDTDTGIDLTGTGGFAVAGRADTGGGVKNGRFAEIWFDTQYIDFSVLANRQKFVTSGGDPVNRGPYGSYPTGTKPLVYIRDFGDMKIGRNRGTGGNFTVNGPPTSAAGPW